jgi:hypothetical protein
MRLLSRIREVASSAAAASLNVADLYGAPTPEALAVLLLDSDDTPVHAPKIVPVDRPAGPDDPPLVASFAQEQMHLLWTMNPARFIA